VRCPATFNGAPVAASIRRAGCADTGFEFAAKRVAQISGILFSQYIYGISRADNRKTIYRSRVKTNHGGTRAFQSLAPWSAAREGIASNKPQSAIKFLSHHCLLVAQQTLSSLWAAQILHLPFLIPATNIAHVISRHAPGLPTRLSDRL
jgi:hypothetical protein